MIVFTISDQDNDSTDFIVRKQKVYDALYWLTGVEENGKPNNHLIKTLKYTNKPLILFLKMGLSGVITLSVQELQWISSSNLLPPPPSQRQEIYFNPHQEHLTSSGSVTSKR